MPLDNSNPPSRLLFITIFNHPFSAMALNMLQSLRAASPWHDGRISGVLCVALDNATESLLQQNGVPHIGLETILPIGISVSEAKILSELQTYYDPGFNFLVFVKTQIMYAVAHGLYKNLQELAGVNVVFLDADTFFIQDPFVYFRKLFLAQKNTPLTLFQNDNSGGYGLGIFGIAPLSFRSADRQKYLGDIIGFLDSILGVQLNGDYAKQQLLANTILQTKDFKVLNVMQLPRSEFPCGNDYWDKHVNTITGRPPVLVHDNWIVHLGEKISRLKAEGWWLLR